MYMYVCIIKCAHTHTHTHTHLRDFPGSPVIKTALPLQGTRVQSLVGELRSHMPHGMAKKTKQNIHLSMHRIFYEGHMRN